MRADVIIVGGGLAGSAVAIGLARAGVRAILIERRAFPRDKPCGEGLLPHGVERLRTLGLDGALRAAGAQAFAGILYRAGAVEARADFPGGRRGVGVRRLALDAAVHEAARAAPGIETLAACARVLTGRPDRVVVELADGRSVEGALVVGADGPKSVVRRAAGLDLGAPAGGRYGLRRHFRLAPGVPLPERVEVSFQGGHELYLTPVAPGIVGVAALCERATMQEGEGSKEERLARLLARAPAPLRERLAGARPASPALACGPLRVRARRAAEGRVLLVGDAAGYVDAITGEGMSLALGSAALAVEAILAHLGGGPGAHRALAWYAARREALVREHEALTHATVFMARHPTLARFVVERLAASSALFEDLLAASCGERSLLEVAPRALLRVAASLSLPGAREVYQRTA